MDAAVGRGEVGSLLFVTDATGDQPATEAGGRWLSAPYPADLSASTSSMGSSTIFPVPLAMASSWDPAVVERAQTVAAAEARSVGIALGVCADVGHCARPTLGADYGRRGRGSVPRLGDCAGAGEAASKVTGNWDAGASAGVHEALCRAMARRRGGRDYDGSYISDAQLYNVYLPPFHAAVEAGVGLGDERVHGFERCSGYGK